MADSPSQHTRPSLLTRLRDLTDQAAWEEFLTIYGPLVFADLRRRGFNHADTEDLMQVVFSRVVQGIQAFDYDRQRGRFRDWLGTIVRYEAIRIWHAQKRQPKVTMPADEVSVSGASDPEWVDAFQARIYTIALERCRPRFEAATWAAFEHVWVQGLTAAAAAAATGLSIEVVYVSKSRVLSALSDVILDLTDEHPIFTTGPC
ncbi:hypothetical protein BH11PLA2_BH11PLA2_25790 [soil metagenome]